MNKRNRDITLVAVLLSSIVILIALVIIFFLIFVMKKEKNEPVQEAPDYWEETIEEKTEAEEKTEDKPVTVEPEQDTPQLQGGTDEEEIPVIDSPYVFAGKNHWLFYKSTQDGDTMADYYAQNLFSEKQMRKIAASLEDQAEEIEKKGAKFVVLIVPNKEVIYDQYMPEAVRRDAGVLSRTDLLVEYLQKNTNLNVIYVKDRFLELRDEKQLIYYKTDTHWNMRGCYVAVQEILQKLYGHSRSVDEITFQEHFYDFSGDLVAKAGVGPEYNVDTVYFLGGDQVKEEEKVEDSLLLVGDSFAEFMKIEMDYYFNGGVVDGNVERYSYNFYDATKSNLNDSTDVVVWECCERHIARLGK